MAKQNFLAGGYIGKLGDTIGQRWKDKKIIRSYVKPRNPNTPAQQTARQQFALANRLAQQAMVINGHQGIWDTSSKPEYAQRVGQAMRRIRLGYPEQDCIPLYPEGQSPSLAVTIQNVTFDAQQQKYVFQVSGFGINNPAVAEISFYSPLFVLQNNYTENIIHGTVDAQTGLIEIDLSAQNTQDGSAVKSNFQQAMQLGFVAIKAKFYDALGADLTNISIQRRFSVPSVIYDFDETTTLQTTTDQVIFTQAITGNRLAGSVTVAPDITVPVVFKTSVALSFYSGVAGEVVNSSFITITQAQQTPFNIAVTPSTANLSDSDATSYSVVLGASRPYIIKDTATASYVQPLVAPVLQSAQVTADSIIFTFDQDLTAAGVARTNVVGYKYNPTGNTPLVPTQFNLQGEDTTQGNTVTVNKYRAGNIAEPFIGKLSFEFKRQDSSAIPELDCDVTSVISSYFVPAADSATQNNNTTVGNYSGKTIGGNWTGSIANPQAFGNNVYHQLYAKLTYTDGTSETKGITGFTSFGSATAEAKTISGFTAGKEIRSMDFFDFSVSTAGGLNQPNLSQNTISVPTAITIDTASWNYDTAVMSFQSPSNLPPFIKTMKSSAGTIEPGDGIIFTQEANTAISAGASVNIDYGALGSAVGLYEPFPIILQKSFLYEDGTECTSINFKVYSPSSMYETPIVDEDVADTIQLEEMTANTLTGGQVTFTLVAGSGLPTSGTPIAREVEIFNLDGDVICEISGTGTLVSGTQVRFPTADNYLTGNANEVDVASFGGIWIGNQANFKWYVYS
ncbi:MAG: hypothetical protein J6V57_04800 [Spirochaetaceae bacterium]|nr:hypothetical protein [Spirochaetaceae bacterium]